MGDTTIIVIGILIGFLFGMTGIATLFNLMNEALSETAAQLSQIGAASTLILLVIALILIIKVRILSSLIVGAIIGAVLNTVLEMNDIHIVNDVFSVILKSLGM